MHFYFTTISKRHFFYSIRRRFNSISSTRKDTNKQIIFKQNKKAFIIAECILINGILMAVISRGLFPSLSNDNIWRHYIPMCGVVSHTAFAVHLLNPNIVPSAFPSWDVAITNGLLFNAHFGTGLYMFYRKHMSKVATGTRVLYSVFIAVIFNFGSVLIWATTKKILPQNNLIRGLFGVLTSFCLLAIGRDYSNYIDTLPVDSQDIEQLEME